MNNISSVQSKNNNDDQSNQAENEPAPAPKNDQFKKIYKKEGQPSKEELEETAGEVGESKEKPLSLFDLAKKKSKVKTGSEGKEGNLKEPGEGEGLDKDKSVQEKTPQENKFTESRAFSKEKLAHEPVFGSEKKEASSAKKKTDSSSGSVETKADGSQLSGLHTPVQGVGLGVGQSQGTPESSPSSTIADLVNQLVESIQIMKKEDLNETVVTLKSPPVLAGATVTLMGNSHAKQEFNIAFNGLNPEAKLFLDQKLSEYSLSDALQKKGIILHMVTTSTEPRQALGVDTGQMANREREQQQEDQRKREQQEQSSEEDAG